MLISIEHIFNTFLAFGLDWLDFIFEDTFIISLFPTLLRLQSIFVGILPCNVVFLSQIFG